MTSLCKYKLLSPDSAGESKDLIAGKNPEDGLRRIQALLAEWLRMENVVILTAAGSSVGAGGRLMAGPAKNNLECLVLDAVEHCGLSKNAKAVIEWKKSNGFGEGNFEEWLSYLFNASGMVATDGSPIHSVSWKGKNASGDEEKFQLSSDDEETLRNFIEKAIYAECALELDRAELTGKSSLYPQWAGCLCGRSWGNDKGPEWPDRCTHARNLFKRY